MPVFSRRYRLFALFALATSVSAFADESQTGSEARQKMVTYRIHEDPNNPGSAVAYEISLLLEEQARHDHEIRWSVERVAVRKPGVGGGADTVWTDPMPGVDTASGNWDVTHADPENPINDDFVLPPPIFGAAVDAAEIAADLEYSFAGYSYSPSGPSPWEDTTTSLSWLFTLDGETTPLSEGTDEPVEVPPVLDPPQGN